MNLRDQLLEAAKPYLKEGLDSSKEIIANNSTSFDEMGMASANPGEFAPEEITDQENLVNVAKMSNDNDFNQEASAEVSVSVIGAEIPDATDALEDLINLGAEGCDHEECEQHEHHHSFGEMIESILREKDKGLFENFNEATLEDAAIAEAIVDDWPDFVPARPGIGKWALALMSRLKANMQAIKSGEIEVPENIKENWPKYVEAYKNYSISNTGDPIFMTVVRKSANELSQDNPDMAAQLIVQPTEEMCAKVSDRLNGLLNGKLEFTFEPGQSLVQTEDKAAKNYLARKNFDKAFLAEKEGKAGGAFSVIKDFSEYLNSNAPAANPLGLSDEDVALLKQYNIKPDHPKAQAFLNLFKTNSEEPAAAPAPKKGRSRAREALESVLAESDYAGNLSYNPDKRLNASDVLNAAKNAVKPELAAALSVVKNVDANQEPSYAIQNIDEKDLPDTLEIDTNTDTKVVLKKDGNSYKIDK